MVVGTGFFSAGHTGDLEIINAGSPDFYINYKKMLKEKYGKMLVCPLGWSINLKKIGFSQICIWIL